MVTIREDGCERQVTAAEAFLLQLARKGLEGDGLAARQSLAAIEAARDRHVIAGDQVRISGIVVHITTFNVNPALEILRMGRKLDRLRPSARMLLEPWIVEAALARLGARRLSSEQQRIVQDATRTPHKVNWPAWWSERPGRT